MAAVAVACSGMGEQPDRSVAHKPSSNSSLTVRDCDGWGDPNPNTQNSGGPGTGFRGGLRLH